MRDMNTPKYSDAFNLAIAFVMPHEEVFARGHWGDENYVITENVSGDSGGLTKWGIDQRSHPGVNIAGLDRAGAIDIYHDEWVKYNIDSLPDKIAVAQFDVRVNGGYAVKWLQTALNAVCKLNLTVDGAMGPVTIAAAHKCDEKAVLNYFIGERDARFEAIAAKYSQDRKFLAGWKQRDADLRHYLIG